MTRVISLRMSAVTRVRSLHRAGRLTPPSAKGLRSAVIILNPGEVMDWHSTGNREELLIALEGRVWVERQAFRRVRRIVLAAGRSLFIPSRTLHRVVNHSRRVARYLYITGPRK